MNGEITMYDMAAVNLVLRPVKTNTIPGWLGRATQAHFLRSLEQLNPNLAAVVHDGSRMRPFTASNLTDGHQTGKMIQLKPSQMLNLRYTTLHHHVTALLLNGLIPQWCTQGVMIHDQPLQVEDVQLQAEVNAWTGYSRYEALLARSGDHPSTIRMEFRSPTAFKKTGGSFMPLPLPELVFGSLLDRWNLFSPLKMPEHLYDAILEHVSVKSHHIQTHNVLLKGKIQDAIPGFMGQVTYHLGKMAAQERQCLHALAGFALYSGVGVKTTMGMGQVRA